MHKTVNVTIGGAFFHLEEEAYRRLESYLASVRRHFQSHDDSTEIVNDIENRMAEEFAEKIKGKKKVIMQEDVEALIKTMGTVEDFKEFESGHERTEKKGDQQEQGFSFKGKRLYRDTEDQILGGVASGIARLLGIDPVIIRLAFVLTIFMGGLGIVLYFILWLIVPEAKTTAEKIEMQGRPITLSAISEKINATVKPAAERMKQNGTLRKIIQVPIDILRALVLALGKILRGLGPLLGRLVGLVIVIGAALGVAAITFTLLVLILNPASPYIDLPLKDIVGTGNYLILLTSGYFLVLIPILFVLLLGASLVALRNAFSAAGVLSIAGLWFASLIVLSVTGFIAAPTIEAAVRRLGAERFELKEKTFPITGFKRVRVDDNTRLTLTQGKTFAVSVQATDRALENIEVVNDDGTLRLHRRQMNERCIFFCGRRSVLLKVTMPVLEAVDARDAARGDIRGFSGSTLTIRTRDSARLSGQIAPRNLIIEEQDASSMELNGSAKEIQATLKDASSLDAFSFTIDSAVLSLSDASRATINVRKSLRGSVADAARLLYREEPENFEMKMLPMGRAERMEMER